MRLLRIVVLSSAPILSTCSHVPAWERETLASRAMSVDVDPATTGFLQHVRGAREVALDPATSGGGGCGCN